MDARRQFRVLLLALSLPFWACISAERQQAITEAQDACYTLSPSEGYQELYAFLSANYPIARESERRGFIETEWKEDRVWGLTKIRTRISAEVVGERCIRFAIRGTTETFDPKAGRWNASGDSSSDDAYLSLHARLLKYSQQPKGTQPAASPKPTTQKTKKPSK
jgi:hypothetical protein